jgi:hypothetical protein
MKKFINEIFFVTAFAISLSLLIAAEYTGIYGLWGSLVMLVLGAAYYNITFFKSHNPFEKLYYYLVMLPLIIGYFALVYKSFGIIDTYTNELIKPNWLNSIYFSVVTWTTLGYGDFKPVEEVKIWVMVEALMGYVYMALLVGKILFLSSKSTLAGKTRPN